MAPSLLALVLAALSTSPVPARVAWPLLLPLACWTRQS